jgi:hypothetical protein
MPDPTFDYINSVAVADGNVLDANQLADMLGARTHSPEGPVGYNGQVDQDNLAFTEVTRDMVRRGTYTGDPRMSASTINTDYFKNPLFTDINLTRESGVNNTRGSTYPQRLVAVSGLGSSFHVRETSVKALMVMWGVTFATTSRFAADDTFRGVSPALSYQVGVDSLGNPGSPNTQEWATRMALYINGVRIEMTDMRFKEGVSSMVRDFTTSTNPPVGTNDGIGHLVLLNTARPDLRSYSGWCILDATALADNGGFGFSTTPLTRGWHDAAMYIGTNKQSVRTQVKRFTVVPLYG